MPASFALACCMVALPTGITVLADGDLEESSTSTYTIDPAAGVVRVVVEVAVTNVVPDRTEGDTIYSRYYTGYTIPALAASTNATAVDDAGRALTVTSEPVPEASGYVLYQVEFAERLSYLETERFTLTYDIVGVPPRAADPTRANPAYFGFGAFGTGDRGRVNVRVVAPDGLVVDLFGDPVTTSRVDGATVYSADEIADPDGFIVVVSARNDEALDRAAATAGEAQFELLSWPGDSVWQSFVKEQIETGVPALAELIGEPWPLEGTLEVIQSSTPYLYGYAGWFSPRELLIEVGEELDQEVVLHELSHAWFNDGWFTDRWVNEGLAQVYSNRVVEQLGGMPQAPDPIDPSDPGFVELNGWGDLDLGGDDDAREVYGYNASFAVMSQIVDEVGDEAMREVLDAVAAGTIAYVGEDAAEVTGAATDWRRFLDLVDELGGSTEARELFEQHVALADQQEQLDDRDATRERYAELLGDGGTWAGPVVIRRHLSEWRFDAADEAIDEAVEVLTARDTMVDKAAALGIDHPDGFEEDYEAVEESFDEVEAAIDEQIETFDVVASAVEAEGRDDGVLATIGLWGTDVPALVNEAKQAAATGDHERARAAANDAVDTVDEAADLGTKRLAIAGGATFGLVVLVTVVTVLIRRRRARHRLATARAEPTEPAAPADQDVPTEPTEPG